LEVIPVIDLMDGTVVRARMGRRDQYRPIDTPLSPTSDPVDVVRGLLTLHPFATIYVADLDGIQGGRDDRAVLRRLTDAFPQVSLWVDNGIADGVRAADWLAAGLGHLVIGSETQEDAALVRRLASDPRVALSLDFRGQSFLGPPELLSDPMCWPRTVIVMTLALVGSGAGPDLERLLAIRELAADRMIYAAGGVRDRADLAALARASVAGALVASCLHDSRVTGRDIAALHVDPTDRR